MVEKNKNTHFAEWTGGKNYPGLHARTVPHLGGEQKADTKNTQTLGNRVTRMKRSACPLNTVCGQQQRARQTRALPQPSLFFVSSLASRFLLSVCLLAAVSCLVSKFVACSFSFSFSFVLGTISPLAASPAGDPEIESWWPILSGRPLAAPIRERERGALQNCGVDAQARTGAIFLCVPYPPADIVGCIVVRIRSTTIRFGTFH